MTEISELPGFCEFKGISAIQNWQSFGIDTSAGSQDSAVDVFDRVNTVKHDRSLIAD